MEHGRLLFAQECNFIWGAADQANLPEATLPEVAFAGRSNAGKSTALNALTGRSAGAGLQDPGPHPAAGVLRHRRTVPGRSARLRLRQGAQGGGRALDQAGVRLSARAAEPAARVCLLIDARHGFKKADEEEILELLGEAAVPFQLVLTKADLVRKAKLEALILELETRLARLITRRRPAGGRSPSAEGGRGWGTAAPSGNAGRARRAVADLRVDRPHARNSSVAVEMTLHWETGLSQNRF